MSLTLILIAALGVFALRGSFVLTAGRVDLPNGAEQRLRFTRPAVFGALIGAGLVSGSPASGPDLVAALVIASVALAGVRGSMTRMVVVGMGVIAITGMLGL